MMRLPMGLKQARGVRWRLPEARCGQNNHPRKNLPGVIRKASEAITSAGKEDFLQIVIGVFRV